MALACLLSVRTACSQHIRPLSCWSTSQAHCQSLCMCDCAASCTCPPVMKLDRCASQSVRDFTVVGGQLAHLTKLQFVISRQNIQNGHHQKRTQHGMQCNTGCLALRVRLCFKERACRLEAGCQSRLAEVWYTFVL